MRLVVVKIVCLVEITGSEEILKVKQNFLYTQINSTLYTSIGGWRYTPGILSLDSRWKVNDQLHAQVT
jgi:hypothetical protein